MPATTDDSNWFIYLLQTAQGSLYTGITTDVSARLATHQAGKGAKYLRGKGPLTLVATQAVANRSVASRLEYQLKRLTADEKRRIMSDNRLFERFRTDRLSQ